MWSWRPLLVVAASAWLAIGTKSVAAASASTGAASFSWTLCGKKVNQNLGGLGPDAGAAELRYYSVGTWSNRDVDLVVTNASALSSYNATKSGKVLGTDGCFGRINVFKNISVSLIFQFVYGDGSGAPIDTEGLTFDLTLYDLEVGAKSGFQENVVTYSPAAYTVGALIEDSATDGGTIFAPISYGNGSNNPIELADLDTDQAERSVNLQYSKLNSVSLGFFTRVVDGYSSSSVEGGRNFLFLGPSLQTTTTTTQTGNDTSCGTCVIWGDPHIITFDSQSKRERKHPQREAFFRTRDWKNDQLSVSETGTFWLVRHREVHIQGRYEQASGRTNVTSLTEIAVGGPFLQNNVLVVRPNTRSTTWNGEPILPADTIPSTFANDLVAGIYHDGAEVVKDGSHGRGIEFSLPMGVKLIVNRWNTSLACAIRMKPLRGGQSGQCGNFNGITLDDAASIDIHADQRATSSEFLVRGTDRSFLQIRAK